LPKIKFLFIYLLGGTIIPQLLNWIGQHFPLCDQKARNVLAGAADLDRDRDENGDYLERPETHPDYWDAIILYVLQVSALIGKTHI
jgi:hypothetical protein